jgi:hypothetical protein
MFYKYANFHACTWKPTIAIKICTYLPNNISPVYTTPLIQIRIQISGHYLNVDSDVDHKSVDSIRIGIGLEVTRLHTNWIRIWILI